MATIDVHSFGELTLMQRELVARLSALRRRVRLWLFVEGLAIVLAEALGLALFTFWADHTFRLGVGVRIGLVVVAAAILIVENALAALSCRCACRWGWWRLPARSAKRIRRPANRDLAGRVASVLELPALLDAPLGR